MARAVLIARKVSECCCCGSIVKRDWPGCLHRARRPRRCSWKGTSISYTLWLHRVARAAENESGLIQSVCGSFVGASWHPVSLNAVKNNNALLDIGGEVISRLETAGTRLNHGVYARAAGTRGAGGGAVLYVYIFIYLRTLVWIFLIAPPGSWFYWIAWLQVSPRSSTWIINKHVLHMIRSTHHEST